MLSRRMITQTELNLSRNNWGSTTIFICFHTRMHENLYDVFQ